MDHQYPKRYKWRVKSMVYLGRGVISMRRRWIYLQICESPIDKFLALHQGWDQAHGFHPIQSKITAKIAGKTIIITKMYQQMQDSDGNDQKRSYTVTNCLEWRHEIEHQFNSSTGCATTLWSSSNVKPLEQFVDSHRFQKAHLALVPTLFIVKEIKGISLSE